MSSPIAIPSSKATSYASTVASSTTTNVAMGSPTSSPRSAGVYVPVHKRLSASPSTAHRTLPSEITPPPLSHPLTYTSSFLLSLRPTAERFHDQIKSRIRASLDSEVADIVLLGRRMKKGSASRKTTQKAGGVRQSTAASSSPSLTSTSTSTSTPTPLTQSLFSNTRPTSTSMSTKPQSTLSSKKTLAPRHTRSSSTRTHPHAPRQMLRLSRAAAWSMNSRESWRGSGLPTSTGVVV